VIPRRLVISQFLLTTATNFSIAFPYAKFQTSLLTRSNILPTPETLDTHQKALSINLDARAFGSFAEIGAGQEVARWFLQVGGASGTVAKTISAYDKEVSDDLYGAGTRYVSRPRLQSMLEHEWVQLLSQLNATRGATTRFFSFVDTIAARNFAGDNDTHGWMGLRFQTQPLGPPNDVILHVNLRDNSNLAQQAAVGILGVNLIYASIHNLSSLDEFLAQIASDLPLTRIEIDCVALQGPAFEHWDPRAVHATLVANHHAEAVVFPADGNLVPCNEILYKKAIVLAPGAYNLTERLNGKMIEAALASLPKQDLEQSKGAIAFSTFRSAGAANNQSTDLTAAQILERVDASQKLGTGVLVFRQREIYKLAAFVNRFTNARIHVAAEIPILMRALQDNYADLEGGLLEGIARLFRENVRLSVFPTPVSAIHEGLAAAVLTGWKWKEVNGFVTARDIEPPEPMMHLYRYLLGSQFILPMDLPVK
jgi:hypothetical protein